MNQKKNTAQGLLIATVVCFCTMLVPLNVHAQSLSDLGINKSISYDIYFGDDDGVVNVVTDVNLVRIVDLNGAAFLVIEADEFKLKQREGFVRFDAIIAILPNKHVVVKKRNKIKL